MLTPVIDSPSPVETALPPYVSLVDLLPVYQRALLAAASHKTFNGRVVDLNRVTRAFFMVAEGKAQARIAHYATSIKQCECEDWRAGNLCKHVLAYMMVVRAGEVSNG